MPRAPATHDVLLRRHGLHVTPQRLAIMRAATNRPHSSADDIYNIVRSEIGAVSRQAVYDSLAALTDKRLLRRIEPAGSPARYEDRVGDNHHHLICEICNRMVDVDCAVGYTPCLTAADDFVYQIDEAEVTFWGRCPDCVTASSAAPAHSRKARLRVSATTSTTESRATRPQKQRKRGDRRRVRDR